MAVAVGRDIHHQIDVESGTAVHNRLGILGDLHIQLIVGRGVLIINCIKVAGAQAAAAAHAFVVVDGCFPVLAKADRAVRAVLGTDMASAAEVMVDGRLAGIVLLHLAGPAAAAHADVLQTAAETGGLVPLEVGKGDKHIGVHDGAPDFCGLEQLAADNRHLDVVGALETVRDDDVTAGGEGGESVLVCGVDVIQRILAPADVQGVAVGQEGLPPSSLITSATAFA